jgi:UDP-glucose 4-epimerase
VALEAAFVEGNILDATLLRRVLEERRVDTVMHFAAFIAVGESCAHPAKYFENNVAGALTVLKAMVDTGVRRFILSSTAAVYGDPDSVPITEDMPTRPKNPYGLSKRMIEQALEWHNTAYGLRSVVLRYFNASGATALHGEAHQPETHLIPNVLMAAEGTLENVAVYGRDYATPDGTCIRDYIHVVDLADAHVLAMRYLRGGGALEIMNLGNSVGHSVLEVVQSVRRITAREVPVVFAGRRPGDAEQLVASSDKARRVLGWQPTRGDIDVIVRDAWAWRRTHPKGYAPAADH